MNTEHNSPIFPSPRLHSSNNIFFAAGTGSGVGLGCEEPHPNQTNATTPNSIGKHVYSPSEHRWSNTFGQRCDVCQKKMMMGWRCKKCKFLCHKDCEKKVPSLCTVIDTDKYMKKHAAKGGSNSSATLSNSSHITATHPNRLVLSPNPALNANTGGVYAKKKSPGNDTSSSCNSSEPNSPNVFNNSKYRKYLNEPADAAATYTNANTTQRSSLNSFLEFPNDHVQQHQHLQKGRGVQKLKKLSCMSKKKKIGMLTINTLHFR